MTTPLVLSDDTITLLGQLADKFSSYRPDDPMREATRLAQALVFAEKLHGPTAAAYEAEQALLAAAPLVRDGQTRGEYAALLRLTAQGVTAG
ncbi:hypothetical protein [Streptomyces sp. NPDC002994]|uniref:hypothetical protein n=1 Tax=Streptomyces sp. NPDC002994 TaxID=3154441 RepID=UPI0033A732DA